MMYFSFHYCANHGSRFLVCRYSTQLLYTNNSQALLSKNAIELGRDVGILSSNTTKEQFQIVVQMLTDKSYLRSKVPNNERLVDLGKQVSILYQHHPHYSKQISIASLLDKLINYYSLANIIKYDTETISNQSQVLNHAAYAILGTLYLQKGAKETFDFIHKHTLQ